MYRRAVRCHALISYGYGSALPDERKGRSATDLVDDCGVILSARERQLLRRFALGKSDKVIVREIGGTQQQIAVQRERLIGKLKIQSQAQLVTLAGQLAAWPAPRMSGIYRQKGRR